MTNVIELNGDIDKSFFPKTQSEILRDIQLKKSFSVNGGLFARNLFFEGTGQVKGPIYSSSDIKIVLAKAKGITYKFQAGLFSASSIAVEESGYSATSPSPLDQSSIFIKGDVVSDIVQLERATIIGNIRGRKVFLKDCSVIGGVFSDEELVLESCRSIFFSGGEVTLKGTNFCWLPYGVSLKPLRFAETATSQAEAKLIFTGFGDAFNIELGRDDIHRLMNEDDIDVYSISLAQRAWDLKSLESEFRKVESFIRSLLLFEHLDASSKETALREWTAEMPKNEASFFIQIAGGSRKLKNETEISSDQN